MSKDRKSKLINFPSDLYEEMEKINAETNIPITQLVVLSTYSFVANYKEKGSFIFADLLNPEHRKAIKK